MVEKDIFGVQLVIESRGYLGTLTTWKTHFQISKNLVDCSKDGNFYHLYDLSIYCHDVSFIYKSAYKIGKVFANLEILLFTPLKSNL